MRVTTLIKMGALLFACLGVIILEINSFKESIGALLLICGSIVGSIVSIIYD